MAEELQILVVEEVVDESDDHLVLGEVPDKTLHNTSTNVAVISGRTDWMNLRVGEVQSTLRCIYEYDRNVTPLQILRGPSIWKALSLSSTTGVHASE